MGWSASLKGTVYSGINNIYDVRTPDGSAYECRIKGKILKSEESLYNPLAPGDGVSFEESGDGKGLILEREPRRNHFSRWNRKREAWQTHAANIDLLLIVVSAKKPPFRPRFADRALIGASQGGVPSAVLLNKIDQGGEDWIEERIAAWEHLGIDVMRCSAKSGEGLEELKNVSRGKTVCLFGPSGVGKSTLLNALIPGINLATGKISAKYDRGSHVTNFGRLLDSEWGARFVDTPGIREILVHGVAAADLPHWFPDFADYERECGFQPCSHRHEPGCAVIEAVRDGLIHPDRYENYLRIREDLEEKERW